MKQLSWSNRSVLSLLAVCGGVALVSCDGGNSKSFRPDVALDAVAVPDTAIAPDGPPLDVAIDKAPDPSPPAPDFGPWLPEEITGPDVDPGDVGPDAELAPMTCGFGYDFPPFEGPPSSDTGYRAMRPRLRPGEIDHAEPDPPSFYTIHLGGKRGDLVMPGYKDSMPLFERAENWDGGTRCYETPLGAMELSEPAAYSLYRDIAEKTTGEKLNTTYGHRTVVGIRGAYPGTFAWHGNNPNRFNDTLVLLWLDEQGRPQVLEFPANTDTGAHVFDAASSLWPNRRYPYKDGWHKGYNALTIAEVDYRVRDDTNSNGHWDSDRNGWLPPLDLKDHDRNGSAHNIHYAQADPPLETAIVDRWSAGCQNIPGMMNWTQFITHAWQYEGAAADYFLLDARDIDPTVWGPCVPDGSHKCPFRVETFPYEMDGDTADSSASEFAVYDTTECSKANEGGPEVVYVLNLKEPSTVRVIVADGPEVDVDVHLLMGDDPAACIARGDSEITEWVPPGRYVVIVDTFVSGGVAKAGPYHLAITVD